jgi:hypothetical protein
MTIQDQKAAVEAAQQLWALVLPDVEPPDNYRFWTWATRFPAPAITRGIARSAAKYRKMMSLTPMTPEEVGRYCSSVIRREAEAVVGANEFAQ